MKKSIAALALAGLTGVPLALYTLAQGKDETPSPSEIAAAAPAADWAEIPESDLLVMTTTEGGRVVIQLAPDFAPVHVANIRALAAERWWSGGTAITRVQDNYVAQWGDPTAKRMLPKAVTMDPPREYLRPLGEIAPEWIDWPDPYAKRTGFWQGWPVASDGDNVWLTHCYGMVGVGRDMAPDTGTGAELYAVIGQAPRHLDRNIAVVGRVIEGMDYLSSRPRGTGDLGFYEDADDNIAITQLKPMKDMPEAEKTRYQYLAAKSFIRYRDARANRQDPFFDVPAGGADVCNIPVPVRKVPTSAD